MSAKQHLSRAITVLSFLPVAYVIHTHVCSVGVIAGQSMTPTFNTHSNKTWVLLWKWKCKIKSQKGDVVFLTSPIDPTKLYTKRITGLPGQLIRPRYPDDREKVLIPLGHVWVEGDNVHSIDSNTYGPVSQGMLVGKVVWQMWPDFGPVK